MPATQNRSREDRTSGRRSPQNRSPQNTVGVPREVKSDEHRVAITPDGVRELSLHGVEVLVESGAGANSSFKDDQYKTAGATILSSASQVWERSTIIAKVKEPVEEEYEFLREDLLLFTFLHLAAYPKLAQALLDSRTCSIAYETVTRADGFLPLLAPMSEVAGRMAVQVGARFLETHRGGRGVLLGGVPGVRPGRVCVLGAGNVGWNSAWIAAGMEAEVHLFDRNLDRLRWTDQIHRGRITTLASNRGALERALSETDLLIGAVLVPGGRAPVLVTEEMVQLMPPQSVVVDVAVDQGGCLATTRETTHAEPVYEAYGVVHYGVSNMPGSVPHTSTWALTNATLPYLLALAVHGDEGAVKIYPELEPGVNTRDGKFANKTVAESLS